MNKNEMDAARLSELLPKLPAEVQERIGYIIQGALLVSENRIAVSTGSLERSSA